MTQQLDPKQVRGLKEELDTLDSLAKIKTIGANLSLSEDGELSATGGGGGGGGVNLYSVLGSNTDGALTQKASTDLLAHKDDFDTLESTVGGLSTAVAGKEPAITAGTTSQYWRGDKTWQTLDKSAVGLGNVDNTSDATKKSNYTGTIASGDTGFVTGGDVYTAVNGTIQAEQTVSTDPVTATVTTDDITTSAVTTAKIDDGAVTTAKIANTAVTASKIDFTTMKKWVPDYANTQTVATPKDYTATADGFFSYCYQRYSSDTSATSISITIRIDDVVIAQQTCNAVDSGGHKICLADGIVPIQTGQRITSDASGDMTPKAYFIPGKWA